MRYLIIILLNMQDIFIKNIRDKSRSHKSFIYEIADILDVGYDAAYRRVHSKTQLTLDEIVLLAKHYDVSLNNLFQVANQNTVLAELSFGPTNQSDLENWLNELINILDPLTKIEKAEMIWSGKDISLFKILTKPYLAKYKMYIWLKEVDLKLINSNISFDEWITNASAELDKSITLISNIVQDLNISELWDSQTINGILRQILYYFDEGLVSKELALLICNDLKCLVYSIKLETKNQSLNILKNNRFHHVYNCELYELSNTFMVITPNRTACYTPLNTIDYFKIEQKDICDKMYTFLQQQKSISKLLVNSGEHERTHFFKAFIQKIEMVEKHISCCKEALAL